MNLYNTFSKKIEKFTPVAPPVVGLYACGPTVYDYTHIGHMRTYTNVDLLRRTLEFSGFKVNHVMNTTDVGHLSGDDDSGEDKLEKGSKKSGKTVWEVAEFFTDYFFRTTDALNILRPGTVAPATKHIPDMIKLIEILNTKGYVYVTPEAVYFDTAKFRHYGLLSGQKLDEKIKGSREEVYVDPAKKHPADFALWFKRVGRFADHTMHWQSPWGDGFPGWHIECSAMSMKYLGATVDIHTGGIDHIPVHHENEIAQSEAATGKPFVRFWFHNNFLRVNDEKMSKSLGNFYTLDDLIKRSLNPISLRYLFLQTHYRQVMNFTWESAAAAQEGYVRLKLVVGKLIEKYEAGDGKTPEAKSHLEKFRKAVHNDLEMPQALAVLHEMLKSDLDPREKVHLVGVFDRVLGLKLSDKDNEQIPAEVTALAEKRAASRANGDWTEADRLRRMIRDKGYEVEDLQLTSGAVRYKIYKSGGLKNIG